MREAGRRVGGEGAVARDLHLCGHTHTHTRTHTDILTVPQQHKSVPQLRRVWPCEVSLL